MGYYMDQRYADFRIKKQNFPEIEKILPQQFPWTSGCFEIGELFDCFSWELDFNDEGDAISICFVGEKQNDDYEFLNTIAPWVEKDSYIEMQGQDGSLWRWCFDGEKCIEKEAKISWD